MRWRGGYFCSGRAEEIVAYFARSQLAFLLGCAIFAVALLSLRNFEWILPNYVWQGTKTADVRVTLKQQSPNEMN